MRLLSMRKNSILSVLLATIWLLLSTGCALDVTASRGAQEIRIGVKVDPAAADLLKVTQAQALADVR